MRGKSHMFVFIQCFGYALFSTCILIIERGRINQTHQQNVKPRTQSGQKQTATWVFCCLDCTPTFGWRSTVYDPTKMYWKHPEKIDPRSILLKNPFFSLLVEIAPSNIRQEQTFKQQTSSRRRAQDSERFWSVSLGNGNCRSNSWGLQNWLPCCGCETWSQTFRQLSWTNSTCLPAHKGSDSGEWRQQTPNHKGWTSHRLLIQSDPFCFGVFDS